MIRHLTIGATAIFATLMLPACASAANHSARPMRITQFLVHPTSVKPSGIIAFTTRATGITLSSSLHVHTNQAGHGRFQYYLDSIPRNAWTKPATHGNYLAAAVSTVLVYSVKAGHVRFHRGTHHIIVALARNDGTLYRVPTKRVTVRVR